LDPVTHLLTGAVLGRAGFNRKTALATATMTLAAEAPDLDVFAGFKGPVYAFAHHRGFTHSFFGLVFVCAVVTGFMYMVWRLRGRKTNNPELPPRWGLLFLFAYIAGLSHILLDYSNNYGVRPFWPFWEKWYSWDIVFIVEPALYIILIAGLLLPLLFRRSKGFGPHRTAAIGALVCVAGFYAVRDHEHRICIRALTSMQFQSQAPLRVSAYPSYWDIFQWHPVAETQDFYVIAGMDSKTRQLEQPEARYISKPPETAATLAAKKSYLGRVYLDWAQYPLVSETREGQDTIVHFSDLRFSYPALRSRTVLSGSVELDPSLHVIAEKFDDRMQSPPLD
jgi:inner membrane protein